MVYIKKIELRNFKTFNKKVTLTLDKGLTVITGPNGSGKSNLLDAIKFSLGELSAKELRGASLSDVITQTTEMPKKSAYVLVQFENDDRRIPIDADVVSVSREFQKNGEGIYRVNGKRVSRKQLMELLSSANIRVSGYNIIPQQSVTRLAELTPDERRQVIEDLVGVKVYDEKREESKNQLTQSDLNLKIAMAKIGEVKARVEELERERNQFLRCQFLTKEKNGLQSQILTMKLNDLKYSLDELNKEHESKINDFEEVRKERESLLKLKNELENRQKLLYDEVFQNKSLELEDFDESISIVKSKIIELKKSVEFEEKNKGNLEKQKESIEIQNQKLENSVNDIKNEIDEICEEKNDLDILIKNKDRTIEEESDKLKKLRELSSRKIGTPSKIEDELTRFLEEELKIETSINLLNGKIDLLKEFQNTIEDQKSRKNKFLETIKERIRQLSTLEEENSRKISSIEEKITEFRVSTHTAKEEITNAMKILHNAKSSLLEHEIQNQLFNIYAKNNIKPSNLAIPHKKLMSLSYGRFKDLIKFDENYRKIIETSFEEWMDALVVEDFQKAMDFVQLFKEKNNAFWDALKIIPLKSLGTIELTDDIPKIPGIVGRAIDFIQSDNEFSPAVNLIFGNTLITEDKKTAFASSLMGFKTIALTGEIYTPGGGIEIKNLKPNTSTLTHEFIDDKLVNELQELSYDLDQSINIRIKDIKKFNEKLRELISNKSEMEISFRTDQAEIRALNQSTSSFSEFFEKQESKIKNLRKSIEEEKKDLEVLINKRKEIKKRISNIKEKTDGAKLDYDASELSKAEEKFHLIGQELQELNRKSAFIEGKIPSLELSSNSISSSLNQNNFRIKEIEKQFDESAFKIDETKKVLTFEEEKLSELMNEREHYTSSISSKRSEHDKIESELSKLEEKLKGSYNNQDSMNISLSDLSGNIKEKEIQIEYISNELKTLGVKEKVELTDDNLKTLESTLSSVEVEFEKIGAVNQLAQAHYDEQSGNYKQLSTRINELEGERGSIINFMNELEMEKTRIFKKAFNEINTRFKEIFSNITGGGSGLLQLEHPDRIFDGGVDLLIQFPGKAKLSINSASGGEKSVATVCFILALQTINPMPFYIFDEIDAHLDVANTKKLANLLVDRSKGSQFIVISLKDAVISTANSVYGTFIQGGSTKIVSFPKLNGENNERA